MQGGGVRPRERVTIIIPYSKVLGTRKLPSKGIRKMEWDATTDFLRGLWGGAALLLAGAAWFLVCALAVGAYGRWLRNDGPPCGEHAIEGDEDDRDTICNTPRRDGTRVFWEMGRAVTCKRCVAELAKRDRRLCRSMGFKPTQRSAAPHALKLSPDSERKHV